MVRGVGSFQPSDSNDVEARFRDTWEDAPKCSWGASSMGRLEFVGHLRRDLNLFVDRDLSFAYLAHFGSEISSSRGRGVWGLYVQSPPLANLSIRRRHFLGRAMPPVAEILAGPHHRIENDLIRFGADQVLRPLCLLHAIHPLAFLSALPWPEIEFARRLGHGSGDREP